MQARAEVTLLVFLCPVYTCLAYLALTDSSPLTSATELPELLQLEVMCKYHETTHMLSMTHSHQQGL